MSDHAAAAAAWMDAHPRAMQLFETMALRRAALGRPFGMKALAEVVRWEYTIDMQPGEDFKINNNHTAFVARRLIEKHPQLRELIELRHVHAAPASEPEPSMSSSASDLWP